MICLPFFTMLLCSSLFRSVFLCVLPCFAFTCCRQMCLDTELTHSNLWFTLSHTACIHIHMRTLKFRFGFVALSGFNTNLPTKWVNSFGRSFVTTTVSYSPIWLVLFYQIGTSPLYVWYFFRVFTSVTFVAVLQRRCLSGQSTVVRRPHLSHCVPDAWL